MTDATNLPMPCPFCGSTAVLENFVIEAQVRCIASYCGAKIVRKHAPKKDVGIERAISAWNRRDSYSTEER